MGRKKNEFSLKLISSILYFINCNPHPALMNVVMEIQFHIQHIQKTNKLILPIFLGSCNIPYEMALPLAFYSNKIINFALFGFLKYINKIYY